MPSRRTFVKLGLGFGVAGVVGTYAYWLVGCWPKHERLAFGTNYPSAAIGVVRESQDFSPSRVYYLSRDLEVLGSISIKHAEIGREWIDTTVSGSKVVLPVYGNKTVPERDKVLALDVMTQELTTWLADYAWCVAANNTRVFTSNNGLSATFSAFGEGSEALDSYEIPNESNEALLWHDGSLWAANIASVPGEAADRIFLHRFSENLEHLDCVEIGIPADADDRVVSLSVNNMHAYDGQLFLATGAMDELGMSVDWNRMCRYDIASGEYTWLTLAENHVWSVRFAQDRMLVLHSDPHEGTPHVCAYDLDGQLIAHSEFLLDRPLQMVIADGMIYLAGGSEVQTLDLATLEALASVEVDPEHECAWNTGLFAMPEFG